MLAGGQYYGRIRLRTVKVLVSPVRGKIARDPRMVDLQRQYRTAVIVWISHHERHASLADFMENLSLIPQSILIV
jgi:hypothetical protein